MIANSPALFGARGESCNTVYDSSETDAAKHNPHTHTHTHTHTSTHNCGLREVEAELYMTPPSPPYQGSHSPAPQRNHIDVNYIYLIAMKGWTEYLMEKTNFSNRMSVQMKLRWMALEWLHLHRRIGKQGDG